MAVGFPVMRVVGSTVQPVDQASPSNRLIRNEKQRRGAA
jgi:hypothetical protein